MNLFEYRPVMQVVSENQVKVFQCFKSLDDGKYYVQSADYFNSKRSSGIDMTDAQVQLMELFTETPLKERTEGYSTLLQAIQEFERGFE